jgi:hypothetical protein
MQDEITLLIFPSIAEVTSTNTAQSNATYNVLFLFALHVSVNYNHLQRHVSL